MKRTINLKIDLSTKMYNVLLLKQLDTTELVIQILKDNELVDLNEQSVDLIFTKPDSTIVQQLASNIDLEKSVATIPLLPDCLRQCGRAKMELEVKDTNQEVVSSFYIPVEIERTSKENVSSENTPNYFEEFANNIDKLKKESDELVKDLNEIVDTVTDNEKERLTAEELRIQKENERLTAEKLRIQKENGRLTAEELRIQKENERLTAEELRIQKEKERLIAEEYRITKFAEIVNNMDVQTISKFINNFGNIYSNESSYSVGDYCLQDNILYKCITEITKPENFDSTKWIATTIINELKKRLEFQMVEENEIAEVTSE